MPIFSRKITLLVDKDLCASPSGLDCRFVLTIADPDDGTPMKFCGLFCRKLEEKVHGDGKYCVRAFNCHQAEMEFAEHGLQEEEEG